MSLRIFVIMLYQCWIDRRRPYSVLLSSQKLSGLESGLPRGGSMMMILSSGSKAFQKPFLNLPC